MPATEELLLLLGGNLGDPRTTLAAAEAALVSVLGPVVARSRDHWTEPWGFVHGALFLDRALLFRTDLGPQRVLEHALAIEHALGRERVAGEGYRARTIDIDILLVGEQVLDTPDLQVPHPRMHLRGFALAPAADIAPGMRHPVLDRTVWRLLNDLRTA